MTSNRARLFSKHFCLGLSLGQTTNHTSENHSDSEESQMGFVGGLSEVSGWFVLPAQGLALPPEQFSD